MAHMTIAEGAGAQVKATLPEGVALVLEQSVTVVEISMIQHAEHLKANEIQELLNDEHGGDTLQSAVFLFHSLRKAGSFISWEQAQQLITLQLVDLQLDPGDIPETDTDQVDPQQPRPDSGRGDADTPRAGRHSLTA